MGLAADTKFLESVFGATSTGDAPEDRARTSDRLFVRSQDHLALHTEGATGRVLTAWEALHAFGFDLLVEAVEDSPAVLPQSPDEPSRSIRARRESLGLSHQDVARQAKVDLSVATVAESPASRTPIRQLEAIAVALGLDERVIGVEPGARGDDRLAVRLRSLGSGPVRLSPTGVAALGEAAWVIQVHDRLSKWIDGAPVRPEGFEPSSNYGDQEYPAWRHGYYLAEKTRELLGVDPDEPIENLRVLTELRLAVPLVQAELPQRIAGATLANGKARGIVVNTRGSNENVWVRRSTIAHELGHLLWDPDAQLRSLAVDEYEELNRAPWDDQVDYVEQRANAFAIEFLAPQTAAVEIFRSAESREVGLRQVMDTFGISFTAARYHVWNGVDRSFDLNALRVEDYEPTDEWRGRESYTIDWFPIDATPMSRRGRFSGLITRACDAGLVSIDTASSYLATDSQEFSQRRGELSQLFAVD